MKANRQHSTPSLHRVHVPVDLSDCYTWSFPEFLPFCSSLFAIASFKDFNTLAQA